MNDNLKDFIELYADDDTIKLDGYNHCIIGIDTNQKIIYDANKIIETLASDMTTEEAVEYFYYNIEGSKLGEFNPIYVFKYEEIK